MLVVEGIVLKQLVFSAILQFLYSMLTSMVCEVFFLYFPYYLIGILEVISFHFIYEVTRIGEHGTTHAKQNGIATSSV